VSSAPSSGDSLKTEAESAYRAWLGYYNGKLRLCGWDKPKLVAMANQWAQFIGLTEQPSLEPKTVGMMGLKGVPGLRIEAMQRNNGGRGGQGGQGQNRGPRRG
jgi:ATP-dependent RNA helicase MSS116